MKKELYFVYDFCNSEASASELLENREKTHEISLGKDS